MQLLKRNDWIYCTSTADCLVNFSTIVVKFGVPVVVSFLQHVLRVRNHKTSLFTTLGWEAEELVYLLQKEMLVGLHAHRVLVFAADLIEEPVQSVIVALGVLHQTVPQDVHLLQTQSCHTSSKHIQETLTLSEKLAFYFHSFLVVCSSKRRD